MLTTKVLKSTYILEFSVTVLEGNPSITISVFSFHITAPSIIQEPRIKAYGMTVITNFKSQFKTFKRKYLKFVNVNYL